MAAKPESKAADAQAEGGDKRGKGLLLGLIAAIVLGGGGGAGWYFTRPAPKADGEAATPAKPAEAVFVNLEPFTVNLADEGGERLAQVAVVLELGTKESQLTLTKQLPVVRNSLLLLISSQQSKTLLSLDGKLALADEIAIRTGTALGWHPEEPEEDEAEEDKPQAKKVGSKRPVRKKPRRAPVPNPVVAVHFSQLLVQ